MDLEEALDASEAQEQAIRDDPELGNSVADVFRKIYTRRWSAENTKRKRRGGGTIISPGGVGEGTAPPATPAPPTPDKTVTNDYTGKS